MKLRLSDIIAAAAVAAVLLWPSRATPPKRPLRPECAAITATLSHHPTEARQIATFYRAVADAIERDGQGAKLIATKTQLRAALERAAILRFQGEFARIEGLSDAIHGQRGALAQMLGLDPGPTDHTAAAEALRAVADAAEAAR